MQSDERDVLAILEFDLREETIGIWLRCIMQRLEEKRGLRKDLPQLFIEAMNRFQGYQVYAGITSKVARDCASSTCFDSDSCPERRASMV